ncbi:hydrolase [Legionella saoudiensis]|uniref:hydrolase n=1 Tax=Legionella saoudiensis TaxID=1750561 RepID=UPI000730FC6A|nr:hydrolase [Legionella saoudiensis]
MIIHSEFKPAWWLTNKHGQTLYRTLTNRLQAPIDFNERIELPDGDFIDLAWAINGLSSESPLVILLYGLGGSVNSAYVAGLLAAFNKFGYRGMLMHFRGASGEPNRLPRAYHGGDTADLSYVLELLKTREPKTPKAAVGISLGGNVLLKWLGESGSEALIDAAVAVSVPFQLHDVVSHINKGFARVYQANLLQRLRAVFLQKLDIVNCQLPITEERLLSLKTLYDFDQQITAPLHGFASVEDYYQKASSRQYLNGITVPTLIIHALDDPFMTPATIPGVSELSENVILELSQHGGHVGFITGKNKHQSKCWLEQRINYFFNGLLAKRKTN